MFSAASLCLFVCQHDNFRTIKRRTMKLGGYVHFTKISSEFGCQGQRSKVTKDKNDKVWHFLQRSSRARFSGGPCVRCMFGRTSLTYRAWQVWQWVTPLHPSVNK